MLDMRKNTPPDGEDVILYLDYGRTPIIAGLFDGEWRTALTDTVIAHDLILGWNYIPEYSYTEKDY
jgi:hypothetical protein